MCKKIWLCSFVLCVAVLIVSFCVSCSSNIPYESSSAMVIDEEVSSITEISFSMEKLSDSYHRNFTYFRDSVTDVMYLYTKVGYSGGLTVMLDPVSGLPLTYTRYCELYYSSDNTER